MTAYFGLMDIGKPKEGETLVVSAAADAVGSMVGQIGKIHGCHVVGIAGSDDKCQWLTEEADFDAAINYKSEDVGAALDKHCPNGIDINFESVGGEIMDAVIARLNDFSRMPLCGLISTYNDTDGSPGPSNFANLLMQRTTLRGFIILDYFDRFPEGAQTMAGWLMEDVSNLKQMSCRALKTRRHHWIACSRVPIWASSRYSSVQSPIKLF